MAFDFDGLSGSDKIALTYTTYYGRLPDPDGFAFWNDFFITQNDAGQSSEETLLEITNFFLDQEETRANYAFFDNPLNASVADIRVFVEEVYFNLFNRRPDDAGREFWTQQIFDRVEQGDGFSDLLVQIIEGAQGPDITAINHKLTVANHYVENIGNDFDLTQATRIAQDTTSEPGSAAENIANIDTFIAAGARFYDAGRSDTYLLISDQNGGEIFLVDTLTETAQLVADTNLTLTTDIAVLPTGDLLVADQSTVYRYSFAAETLTPVVNVPTGIAALEADENGRAFVAGADSAQLFEIDVDQGVLSPFRTLLSSTDGDIAISKDQLFVNLQNDILFVLDTDNPSVVTPVQENANLSSFSALVQLGDRLIAGNAATLTDITDADTYTTLQTLEDPNFDEISGATYVYDSLVDYLLT